MALIPHKQDPNFEEQMKQYRQDNSAWGGDDLFKGMPQKSPEKPGQNTLTLPKKQL